MVRMMEALRREGWEKGLFEFVAWCEEKAFAWGENDCATFAAGCVRAMTGVEVLEKTWESAKEAAAETRRRGGPVRALADVATTWGWKHVDGPKRAAGRGDVVVAYSGDGRTVYGVCLGTGIKVPGKTGLVDLPLGSVRKAWRIPLKGAEG